MTSGRKSEQINTRERVVSSDWNRLQRFIAGYANEAMREQMLAPVDDSLAVGTTFFNAGPISAAFDVLVPSAPDYAGVLNGLMVVAPAAATYLLVTSGMLLLVDPEGLPGSSDPTPTNPDDGPGPSRLVYSAGVTAAGALAWTPNPGPGTRVDIVEVQRTQLVAETDNRDIFDIPTGLFTPQSVTKVTVGDLTYRIRLGTPGGGLPAPALGWVPIAVMASAAGSVNLDTVTIWDVRPLLSDLAAPFAQVRSVFPRIERHRMVLDGKTAPSELRLSGESVGTYLGWKMGGIIREPDVATYVDLANAPFYQAAGFVPTAGLPFYVYSLWPGGYVRWVRYYPTPVAGVGGRVPGPWRGIMAVSQVVPQNGQPLAPVGVPPAWGLSTSTILGQMIAAGQVDTGGALTGFIDDGDMVAMTGELGVVTPAFSIINLGAGDDVANFVLTPGVHFPAGSRRVRLAVTAIFTGLSAGDQVYLIEEAKVRTFVGGLTLAEIAFDTKTMAQPNALAVLPWSTTIEMPVAADGISTPPALGFSFRYARLASGGGGAGVLGAAQLTVIGWDL